MIGYILLGVIGLLLIILLIRAALFVPKPAKEIAGQPVEFDRQKAVDALAELVRCRTVSNVDPQKEDDAEFRKLIRLLPTLYPRVFDVCSVYQLPDRAFLLRLPGRSNGDPTVLMAHYDVVDVEESKWDKPPFAGIIENGILWGRGTLDTKATVNGILYAANHLIGQGFQPENDIYFAFSGGEEVNGPGAANIVDYFRQHHIQPALVLDEGGAVVENVFPGVHIPCGLIGIAEKGMMNVEFSVVSGGGHASAPPADTPIDLLAKACRKLHRSPFKMHLTKPAKSLFDTLGRHSTFPLRIVFANLWLFAPVLDLICRLGGGELNALVRTTVAFTQMEGSTGRNVIPPEAKMVANLRLNPADTVESATFYLNKTVHDSRVKIRVLEGFQPSPVSRTDCEAWQKVAQAVEQTWNGCVVAPYLMVQCADARHYGTISDKVYRFCAMDLTAAERKTIHGNNEGIRLETVAKSVEFYIRLMENC